MNASIKELDRRGFCRVAAGGLASFALWPDSLQRADAPVLSIVILAAGEDVARGVALGLSEARHAAGLFGRGIESRTLSPGSGLEIRRASREGAQVLLLAERRNDAADVAAACADHGLVFINASMPHDRLRRERCGPLEFHVPASESMLSDARGRSGESSVQEAVMWHPSLVRFGAAQLNDRFRHSHHTAMTSDAWAGWMAVKVAWEAFLRAPAATPIAIAEYLSRSTTGFDGHKGVPLSFRAWDHQLRQPLYLVGKSGPVIEVPASPGPETRVSDLLDTIGDPPGLSRCSR